MQRRNMEMNDGIGTGRSYLFADHFDADPNDCAEVLRFISDGMQVGIYDDLGMTASESVQKAVESLEDPDFSLIWEEVNDHA